MKEINRVTGKQVLHDAVTLVKDAGLFVFDLGRLVVYKVKNAIDEHERKRNAETQVAVVADAATA